MYTLPHGHPSGSKVAGGAKAGSEVESATTSDSVEVDAYTRQKPRKRRTTVKAEPAPEVIEEPTEDKPEE